MSCGSGFILLVFCLFLFYVVGWPLELVVSISSGSFGVWGRLAFVGWLVSKFVFAAYAACCAVF